MPTAAPYDAIADWYENTFLRPTGPDTDALGITRALHELLGTGTGTCLEIGCGTGIHASTLHALGWTPVGVDVSRGMLRHARTRLPTAQADASHLPFHDGTMPAVLTVMAHTDMPRYPQVLTEAARVLQPDGVFVHIGVHPCFCGGFADRADPDAIIIRPGYLDHHWTTTSWTRDGIRDKVGATHYPLPDLLHALHEAGLHPERFREGGTPTPTTLAIRARR